MKLKFLITGTDTGVGKSTVGCAIGFALRARALRVGVMKPAETGCEARLEADGGALEPADARALALASGCDQPLDLICPFRYRSPLAPPAAAELDALDPPDIVRIADCYAKIEAASDAVLVEGAGGLAVPIAWGFDYADLAALLDLPLIVVIANKLGCLNAALLTLSYARAKRVKIAGWLLNDVEPALSPAARTNAASLARMTDVPSLGVMRHKEPLAKTVIEKLLARG